MERIRQLRETLLYRSQDLQQQIATELCYLSPVELSDRQLLAHIDPFLDHAMTPNGFITLLDAIGSQKMAVDYGAGCNPFRASVFARVRETYAIDPAYYSYNLDQFPTDPDQLATYGVFGGRGVKRDFINNTKHVLKHATFPDFSPGQEALELTGHRQGLQRHVHLIPQYVETWLSQSFLQTPVSVVWRAFPSARTWGDILTRIPVGGILITTGYGQPRALPGFPRNVDNYPSIACGQDVDNSALPRNGNTHALGLVPLVNPVHVFNDPREQHEIYFYRKTAHLHATAIESALLRNL